MANNKSLFCVKGKTFLAYDIVPGEGSGGSSAIVRKDVKGDKIKVSEISVLAIQAVNDRYDLVVCCPQKGLKRYTISP